MSYQDQKASSETKDPDLARLDALANLLDNQFAIPGTNFRFGVDGIIGLIPYVGDIIGLVISGALLRIMVRKGAGPILMLRMMGNFALDTIVGVIPIIGDFFDFGFKANRRNVDMLKRYYESGKKRPNAKSSMAFLSILFFVFFAACIWLTWKAGAWVFSTVTGLF